MPGIYIMAALTLVAATMVIIGFVYVFFERKTSLLWLLLLGLPLSFAVNMAVKSPLARLVAQLGGIAPVFRLGMPLWWLIFLAMLAPLTEEAIKLVPLLLPPARRLVQSKTTALWVGFLLGASFGLGEVIYLAYSFGKAPQYADLPWFMFQGFLGERLLTVPAHGLLTAIIVYGMSQGWKKGVPGYLAAVLLHALINLGAILVQLKMIDALSAQIPLVLAVVLLFGIFERLRKASRTQEDTTNKEDVIFERTE